VVIWVWICVSSTEARQIGMLQRLTKSVPMRHERHDCSHPVLSRLRGSSLHILRCSQADTVVGFTKPRNANSTLPRDQSEEPPATYDHHCSLLGVILDICWNNAWHGSWLRPFNLSSRSRWGIETSLNDRLQPLFFSCHKPC
jgi:hypothetical protein